MAASHARPAARHPRHGGARRHARLHRLRPDRLRRGHRRRSLAGARRADPVRGADDARVRPVRRAPARPQEPARRRPQRASSHRALRRHRHGPGRDRARACARALAARRPRRVRIRLCVLEPPSPRRAAADRRRLGDAGRHGGRRLHRALRQRRADLHGLPRAPARRREAAARDDRGAHLLHGMGAARALLGHRPDVPAVAAQSRGRAAAVRRRRLLHRQPPSPAASGATGGGVGVGIGAGGGVGVRVTGGAAVS